MLKSQATNTRHASGRYKRTTLAGKRHEPVPYTTTTTITPATFAPPKTTIGTRTAPTLRTLHSTHYLDLGKGARSYKVMHVSGDFLIMRSVSRFNGKHRVNGVIRVDQNGATYAQSYPVHSKAHIVHLTVARAKDAVQQNNPFYGGSA